MNVSEALRSLCPEAEFSVINDSYNGIEWYSLKIVKPTKEEVDAEIARLKAAYDSKQYQRLRATEYPSLADQLDMQYHDAANGTTTWLDAINAVKAKYPKPE